MTTQKEGPDIGSWQENLSNRRTREIGAVDSRK